MTNKAREILERALDLPATERAVVAAELLASLEQTAQAEPEDVQRAWAREIERRLREVVEGRAKTIPFEEAMKQAREALKQARAARRS